ncbi:MAG: glycosyltransferase family 4 protein [Halobacteriota archaeon]
MHLINDLSQGAAVHRNAPLVQILHHLPSSELKQLPLSRSRIAITLLAALEKRALKRAQAIICDSKDTMAQALARYPEHAEKLRVVPNGVDVSLFTPADTPTKALWPRNRSLRVSRGDLRREKVSLPTLDSHRRGQVSVF